MPLGNDRYFLPTLTDVIQPLWTKIFARSKTHQEGKEEEEEVAVAPNLLFHIKTTRTALTIHFAVSPQGEKYPPHYGLC